VERVSIYINKLATAQAIMIMLPRRFKLPGPKLFGMQKLALIKRKLLYRVWCLYYRKEILRK